MTPYKFKTQPFNHQREAWEQSKDREGFALLMEMGTGKTKVALDTMGWLYDSGRITGALVFGNKGSYANWITKEIPAHLPDHIQSNAVLWTGFSTQKKTAEYMTLFQPSMKLRSLFSTMDPSASVKKVSYLFAIVMAASWLSIDCIKHGITAEFNIALGLFLSSSTAGYLGGKALNNQRDNKQENPEGGQ